MKKTGCLLAGATLFPYALRAAERYQLVIPVASSELEKQAAKCLQQYLTKLYGSEPAILTETGDLPNAAIFLGKTAFADRFQLDTRSLVSDGYQWKVEQQRIMLLGGSGKGLLYGVYDLLEQLGVRRYSPTSTYFPKRIPAAIQLKDKLYIPKIRYRTTSYSEKADADFKEWHKLSSRDDWGLFVHTFNTLVPPEEYGTAHPEYFSLIKNKRLPGTQLCLSNPEVVRLTIDNLAKKIKEKPDARYWSVSQNDNDQYCQCSACTRLNEQYGNVPSGSILYFVNQVAAAFPDKIISTLAYWYSRKAPQHIQAASNVNIMLCNIESKRQGPVFETDPAFSDDLRNWGEIAQDILLWDYNIQFTNLFAPFPNLYTIKPNIQFYTQHHVGALYMQSTAESATEMAVLRAYLIYRLMWNPEEDDQLIMDDFVKGYYGEAGVFIKQYIQEMHEAMLAGRKPLDIFGDPIDAKDTFLSEKLMNRYDQLFDKAEKAVANEDEYLRRVAVARLPVLFAKIQIGRTEIDTPRSLYAHDADGFIIGKPAMKLLVKQFVDGCKREDVKLVRERAGSPDHFMASYDRIFQHMEAMRNTLSYRKKVIPITSPAAKSKGVDALTDGIFGSYESWKVGDANWVFYEGNHMDFILDLGAVMPINRIQMDFLNAQAQPEWNQMVLPKYVRYALSADNITYEDPIVIDNPHDPNPFVNKEISQVSIFPFLTAFTKATSARYIKVHAESILKMPEWHILAGSPAAIYTDQIVVS